ncbi:hypothetical protein MMC19_004037 [Ptychographa xylographoides]|nr:hypothetical protein [Ptychographa xylographoides]
MSPIVAAKGTGPAARRVKKRGRKQGANSESRVEDVLPLDVIVKAKRGTRTHVATSDDVAGHMNMDSESDSSYPCVPISLGTSTFSQIRVLHICIRLVDPERTILIGRNYLGNRFAALSAPSPDTRYPVKRPLMQAETSAPIRIPKPNVVRTDVVLAPPHSAFTFTCSQPSRPAVPALPYAGSQKTTPIHLAAPAAINTSTAGSPPLQKIHESGHKCQDNVLKNKLPGDIPETLSSKVAEMVPKIDNPSAEPQPRLDHRTPTIKRSPTSDGLPVPLAPLHISAVTVSPPASAQSIPTSHPTGWPEVEPYIPGPATRDRQSRFFPSASTPDTDTQTLRSSPGHGGEAEKAVAKESNGKTGHDEGFYAVTLGKTASSAPTDTAELLSPSSATSCECEMVILDAPRRLETDKGSRWYGKSATPGSDLSPALSPTLSVSGEWGWEGRDAGFWTWV